jgi:hypothetical protein
MDAQATMRLMFDTMDAYDRGDFDRLGEIYAKDARWSNNVDLNGPHCRNRDDIFARFRQRRNSGVRITFDEMRSTPTQAILTARIADSGPVVSVFGFKGRRITSIADDPSMEAAESATVQGENNLPGW